jgi:hypothetical protein
MNVSRVVVTLRSGAAGISWRRGTLPPLDRIPRHLAWSELERPRHNPGDRFSSAMQQSVPQRRSRLAAGPRRARDPSNLQATKPPEMMPGGAPAISASVSAANSVADQPSVAGSPFESYAPLRLVLGPIYPG